MSVINKMLRDLDQRQVPDETGAAQPGATPLRSGTASVSGVLIPTRTSRRATVVAPIGIAMAVLAACGGAAWWWLYQAPVVQPPAAASPVAAAVSPIASAPVAPAVPASITAPVATAAASAPVAQAPVLAASGIAAKPSTLGVGNAPAVPTSAPAPSSASLVAQATPKPLQPPPNVVAAQPLPTPAAAVAATNPLSVPDGVSTGQRQQQAARDALAQAQGLWNAGAHDNAIDLLQQAVSTAERSAHSTPGAPATQALTSLARELARMQVAQGRPGASVDMLARLEPLLGGDADIWAVRANAAQRAGRHQDSVTAYTAALQSRPNEQRWLLGAAVSSAALGQTANASAFADKAAAVGPIAKDVQAYLRQMGVPLKD